MIDTYAPLTFTGRTRDAALPILNTVLGETLGGKSLDYSDGTLTITIDCDVWQRLSSGERVLFGVLEQIAGHVSTVTLYDIGARLDEGCKGAVIEAYSRFFGLEAAA